MAEARDMAERLLALFEIIYHPIPQESCPIKEIKMVFYHIEFVLNGKSNYIRDSSLELFNYFGFIDSHF